MVGITFIVGYSCLLCSVLGAPYGYLYGSSGTAPVTAAPGGGGGGGGGGGATTPGKPVYNSTADISVLQYALTLENLEAAFYVDAVGKHTSAEFQAIGLTDRDYQILVNVRDHEVTHVAALSAAIAGLGATPVPACTYKFPATDVKTLLAIARALEKTGVSAYDAAAQDISNPAYLTVAATIVTVEARHAAFFNYITGKNPASAPFDIPLGRRQIVTLASPFIASCPYDLPAPFAGLTISPASGPAGISLALTTSPAGLVSTAGVQCAFITGSGKNWLVPVVGGACAVPATLTGEVYVVLTSAASIDALNDSNTLAGPASFAVPDKGDVAA
ncbi:hypothetical protein BV898_17377 [Hypsibius exemplaris]|uniref:Protein rds1 n=1 Tax=Hypsibius exemplaris TaxID=2072580 RepID=A0A9X6NEZ0_HYPEX|nr:hypothetical protein BV898_17377 [Hypsibius exemplaris]